MRDVGARAATEEVSVGAAQLRLGYLAVYIEKMPGRTALALRRMKATHYALPARDRLGALEVHRAAMALLDARGERAGFEEWLHGPRAASSRWPTREGDELQVRTWPKVLEERPVDGRWAHPYSPPEREEEDEA